MEIILYQYEECPYCERVRQKLKELKLQYEKVNVSYDREGPFRKELLKKSGVATVPVIKIDGKYIGESAEIITYLEKQFGKKQR
ncbi:MAG: glutathione S-transferase N-terminal domain-containing protein [Nanoarchaeota archaeon]|nr:glutathione S-transferase N-terminal domain-containing protein [Nanoarchaeota archaeon]